MGRWCGRYKSICDPTLRGGRHRVLMVTAVTISSLRAVKLGGERVYGVPD